MKVGPEDRVLQHVNVVVWQTSWFTTKTPTLAAAFCVQLW
jgi:hypothetical protein